jgi:hypothetical protein
MPPTDPTPPAGGRAFAPAGHEPWAVLESLLQRLTDTAGLSDAVRLTVESARDAAEADAAFWYSVQSGRAGAVTAGCPLSEAACGELARRLLATAGPADELVFAAGEPPAALLARSLKSAGCVVAVRFAPGRPFTPADGQVAKLALRLLVSQRSQSQANTRQLLLGLLHSLTAVIDAKDPYTAGHSERVARIAVLVGGAAGLSEAAKGDLYLAGLLHDVGKIGTPDAVLQKPGRLTPEEYDQVKHHPTVGERIVASIKPFDKLRPAVRHHHERWDGAGYPDGLAGEAVPLYARVLGVADAVDAMMSPRRYRPGLAPPAIDAILTREAGRQFDPALVQAFAAVKGQVYPPLYQQGIGDSAFHAVDKILDEPLTARLPALRPPD